ncbi:glycosyl transferase family 1 [Candidatus Magnetomorum sp. HK-1]|nr:glycosyl transferase family 1 [Candidatus Magnetomorum sp. HK-1]
MNINRLVKVFQRFKFSGKMKEIKNILFVHDHHPIDGGGVEVNTFSVAKELVKQGYDVTIATSISSCYESKTGFRPLKSEEHEGVIIEFVASTESLENLIKKHDVVHSQITFSLHPACLYTMEYCDKIGKIHFASVRTAPDFVPFSSLSQDSEFGVAVAMKRTRELLNSKLCIVSVPATFMIDSLEKNVGVINEINVIHNGIPELEKPESRKIQTDLLYLGHMASKKGVDYIIEAVHLLRKKHPQIKVTMAGSGHRAIFLRSLIKKLGLKDNFIFQEYVPHARINELINSTKALLLPSLTEVWPAVILEGLYFGKTVIASDVGGIPEMLDDGKRGLIFKSRDVKDLAKKIDEALTNKEIVKKFSNQENHPFKIDQQVDELLGMYSRTLNAY